ncbi:hypothetical protein D3C80_1724940 [compost metagenome]
MAHWTRYDCWNEHFDLYCRSVTDLTDHCGHCITESNSVYLSHFCVVETRGKINPQVCRCVSGCDWIHFHAGH